MSIDGDVDRSGPARGIAPARFVDGDDEITATTA